MRVKCLLIGLAVLFAAGILTSSSYAVIDPNTVLGVWMFDEGTGDTAKDTSVNKNDGKLIRSPLWVDGKFDKALQFDGATSYVTCGGAPSLDSPSAITVMAWVKPLGSSNFGYTAILGRGLSASWGLFTTQAPSTLSFRAFVGGVQLQFSSTKTFEIESWTHIAVSYDSKKNVTIYWNGVPDTSVAATGKIDTTANALQIGNITDRVYNIKGVIDEVALFNVPLEQDDIEAIMNEGLRESLGLTAVELSGKLTTTWAGIKAR